MVPPYLVTVLHLDTRSMASSPRPSASAALSARSAWRHLRLHWRRLTALTGFIAAAVLLYFFSNTGAHPQLLFALLFGVAMFSIGLLSLLSGPVAIEAAPLGLVASTIGFVSGVARPSAGASRR
ncbi:hypothetical protein [Paraburkholderia dipogonis]|uniref:hypothetical protein n=1 Tax=Paraburkholderia dipogonis TaxID=1211383 RepID=UPI001FCB1379|nr:hypothetical protein [Paraburkholderia dipogonis]